MTQAPTPGPLSGDDWLTIDTAPKDGSRFESQDRTNYKRRVFTNTYWYVHPAVQGFVTEEIDCTDYEFEPTHWRPSRLAPTAPVEASGSERESVAERVEALADRIDDITDERHFPAFLLETAWELQRLAREEILPLLAHPQPSGFLATLTDEQRTAALSHNGGDTHPQPSGETRERARSVERIKGWLDRNPEGGAEPIHPDDLRALIRPAPVASGGQHSSGEAEPLRVLLDNLVIAQTLSKDLRQKATDEARSYLYELRHAAPVAETAGEAVARSMADTFRAKIAAIPLASEIIHGDGPITQRLSAEHFDALILEARSPVAETVGKGHRPECWGATSYSDEMAHCYCSGPVPAQDNDKLRIAVEEALADVEYVPGDHPIVPVKHDRFVKAIRSALKSTAAKEGGA